MGTGSVGVEAQKKAQRDAEVALLIPRGPLAVTLVEPNARVHAKTIKPDCAKLPPKTGEVDSTSGEKGELMITPPWIAASLLHRKSALGCWKEERTCSFQYLSRLLPASDCTRLRG